MRARVDSYEVTWTRHVTQKHKTWHDGTFRFHAYNQRAQLFDSQGYKVVCGLDEHDVYVY